jgi:hypothetical protein
MRKVISALAIGLLLTGGGLAVGVKGVSAAPAGAKVVIVVGAVQGQTSGYRNYGDSAAAAFAPYTTNIVKVYSPNATWANVQAAAQGATVLVYIGHGSGYPNPYVSYLQPDGDNGMGLNASAANSDYNLHYYGENYMAQLNLAPNAVVILSHLCYASGDNEPGTGAPSLAVAQTRVDGYASGFLDGNARAVIADGLGGISSYVDAIFTANETLDQAWRSAPNFHNSVIGWPSTRNPGFTSEIDPNYASPQSDGDPYYRSLVTTSGFSTQNVGVVVPAVPATYTPIAPTRILDTRSNVGLTGAFGSHSARLLQVTGGAVPSNATAVTGNLTVTGQTAGGYLYVGPYATSRPSSSTLNFPPGDDRANAVTVALGAGGTLGVTFVATKSGPIAHVIFDVTGYFTPDNSGATFVSLAPKRLLDTRSGTGLSGLFSSHVARTLAVAGSTVVPAGATAITGNVTVTQQTSGGYLYVGPAPANDPSSSTLNFPIGDDRANAVNVALGNGTTAPLGSLSITYVGAAGSAATSQVIFDVTGYFIGNGSGAKYVPLNPVRVLDTRNGTGGFSGPFGSHAAGTFQVTGGISGVPAGVPAVTGNLTVTQQSSGGYLYVGPTAMNDPTSSTLNFPIGDDRANAVTVALAPGGTLSATYVAPTAGKTAHVIFDVSGYFTN